MQDSSKGHRNLMNFSNVNAIIVEHMPSTENKNKMALTVTNISGLRSFDIVEPC